MKNTQSGIWQRTYITMLAIMLIVSSALTPLISGPLTVNAADGNENTFYVSKDGNDDNDGSESAPFATIEKAYEKVVGSAAGTIVLLSDISLSSMLTLGKTVTIKSPVNTKSSIVRDANFTNNGLIYINKSGIEVVFDNIVINGADIEVTKEGAAVYVGAGTAIFKNTEVKNHRVKNNPLIMAKNGGSIIKIQNGTVISDNTVTGWVEDNPPSILGAGTKGQLIIEGGSITNNIVGEGSNGVIVGIGLHQTPSFTMTGGEIKNNILKGKGENSSGETVGNVAVNMRGSASQAKFIFAGTAFVYGNKDENGQQRNVFLKNNAAMGSAFLYLNAAMQPGAKVGVFANIMPTLGEPVVDVAKGYNNYVVKESDAQYFHSDIASQADIKFHGDSANESNNKVILAFPSPPELSTVWLDQTEVNGKDLVLTFSGGIELKNLEGFAVIVGGQQVTPESYEVNGNRLTLTFADKPAGDIQLTYTNDDGNLKGTNEMPVADFVLDYAISIATDLTITKPEATELTDSKPKFEGTAVVGSSIAVVIKDKNSNVVNGAGGAATVDENGNWSFEPSVDLAVGDYTVEVTATSPDGKTSVTKSKDVAILPTVTLTEPMDGTVTSAKPTFTGTATSGAKVKVKISDNITLEATADSEGKWSVTPDTAIPNGDYAVEITAEKDGKTSELVPKQLTVNAAPPAVSITKPAGTAITATPEIGGTVDEGATVEVVIKGSEGNIVPNAGGAATVDEHGNWTFTPQAGLTDGDYTIEVIATKDGKTSVPATKLLKVDTATPPSYDDLFTITKPAGTTDNPMPTIGGTVEVSTTTPSTVTIELKDSNGIVYVANGVAEVDANGTWSFTPPANLPDGEYTITATATDGTNTATKTHTFTIATAQAVNKTALQNKADEHLNLNAGNYTPYTWLNYNTALQQAQNVLANPNATQAEVDQALTELTAAQNALVLVVLPGRGLISLIPSTGSLSPNFQTDVTDYTMYVGNSTAVIGFGALPVESGATVSTTVNGQPGTLGQIPLQVGANAIEVTVTDANGFVKRYTITVYRDAYTDGGTWTPAPAPTPTPAPAPEQPQNNKTIIRVDLEVDGENPLEKTTVEIERTTHSNGEVTDFVNLTAEQAFEAVEKAKQIGNTIARIVIPDAQDIVDQVNVEVPKEALRILRDNRLDLEISTDNAHIAIPNSSMDGVDDNFYFRLIPVKKESERQAIEERVRIETVVQETLQSDNVNVVARPMTIETNLPSRPVAVTLPLRGVTLPTAEADRQAYLNSLAVFIEHSDGEKKVVHPKVVTMQDGDIGLRFTVEKFSTFTIIQVKEEVHSHTPYIRGFEDGTFRPEDNITRAQAARMIARILGYEEGTKANAAPFKDIPNTHFAAGEIAFVKSAGIMDGDENGNFNATNNITRAQMAKVVANFKKLAVEENAAITFTDTKGHWAQWIIEANRDAGIISGYPDGRFAPNEAITRVQAVRMMNRMLERGPLYGVPNESFSDVPKTHRAFNDIEEAARAHSYSIDGNQQEQFIK